MAFLNRLGRLSHGFFFAVAILVLQGCGTTGPGQAPVAASDAPWWRSRDGAPTMATRTASRHISTYLTMRDGTKLAVDVYIPIRDEGEHRFPTILEQTRYWRAMQMRWPVRLFIKPGPMLPELVDPFVAAGYARVIVDVRGSGASSGTRTMEWSAAEVADSAEIVDWIVAQPWSDGQVGVIGVSYGGTAAELALSTGHPAIKAAAVLFSSYDVYRDIAFPGGLHLTGFTREWSRANRLLDRNDISPSLDWKGLLAGPSVKPVPGRARDLDRFVSEHESNYDVHAEALTLTHRDDHTRFGWTVDDLSPASRMELIRQTGVPILGYSGWFDGAYARAAIERFQDRRVAEDRLVIGPWNHGGRQNASPWSPSPESAFDHIGVFLAFFDRHLQGMADGPLENGPIHYFTMGAERWNSSSTWPPPGTSTQRLHLRAAGGLHPAGPAGDEAPDLLTVNETWTSSRMSRWRSLLGGTYVRYPRDVARWASLLSYRTAPLCHDVELTGAPRASIVASTSGTDAALFAYLAEVLPSGDVIYITEGQLRGMFAGAETRSFRRADARLLPPVAPVTYLVEMLPTSYTVRAGSRIVLFLSGADGELFRLPEGRAPTMEILHDGRNVSFLDLPTIGVVWDSAPNAGCLTSK